MAAVPIYVWNGTAWQETGPTIPASPIKYQASAPSSPSTGDIWVDSDGDVTTGSQQFQRFRFVASGGETTISGNDANGATLAYTAGLEQVVLNGAVLVRGHDYTATNGTSITGLSPALVANDVLEVFSFIAFTVANTYTQSQVDGLLSNLENTQSTISGTSGALTTTSTSYTDLSTVKSVTLNILGDTIGVFISNSNRNSVSGAFCQVSFELSGANTLAANDNNGYIYQATGSNTPETTCSQLTFLSGLNAGNTTVTMKYKVSSGTGTFNFFRLSAWNVS